MAKNDKETKVELFFPYYINQSRLLDIYAILNGGYSEYAEITTGVSTEKTKSGKLNGQVSGGFKLVNLGGTLDGELAKTDGESRENREKKVQTITSILSMVKTSLADRGYLVELLKAEPGNFVCLPVNLQINSIKSLITEMTDILKLITNMQKVGVQIQWNKQDIKKYEDILKSIQILFAGEEILFETDEFAITGNILDENLYQGTRSDLINVKLTCLAQVKRVFPDGTELMKNTIFTKIKDTVSKDSLITSMQGLTSGNIFDFEATAVSSIKDKPVYQLEIIALYQ